MNEVDPITCLLELLLYDNSNENILAFNTFNSDIFREILHFCFSFMTLYEHSDNRVFHDCCRKYYFQF